MEELKALEKKLQNIEEALDGFTAGAEEMLYEFEDSIVIEMDMTHDPKYVKGLKKIYKNVQAIKKTYDFYDEDTILDYMFPNGQDED